MTEKKHKWFVAINPMAGKAKTATFETILEYLNQTGIDYKYRFSERRLGITSLVKEAIEKGYQKIIAVGGDGTNNEAINGIFQQTMCPTEDITYALIPVGTGNDWVKQFPFPKNEKWVPNLNKATAQKLDIAKIQYTAEDGNLKSHYFINVAGFAFDGQIVKDLDEVDSLSQYRYFLQIFKGLFSYKPQNAKVISAEKTMESDAYTINIGMGIYSGGGMQFVPHGGQNNGKLAVTVVKSMSPMRVITSLPTIYNGNLAKHPKATCFETEKVEIQGHKIPCEVDGEFLGYTPCEISVIQKSLNVIVP